MKLTLSLRHAAPALGAAFLFGASTPLAKLLVGDTTPLLLAGLLYLGSGLGLTAVLAVRHAVRRRDGAAAATAISIPGADLPWLLGAIVVGGMLGPALLMAGLTQGSAASASLLLNLEGVFTALLAWWVFHENADRRIVAGMFAIVAGGALLSWQPGGAALAPGALLIVAACLCWAVDNNLTRKVSTNDALLVAGLKGWIAGACNTSLALLGGATLPAAGSLAGTLLVGFAGYGLSLALFVVALRGLGTARTAAYFSVAPLVGVAISLAIWPVAPSLLFWVAAALMAIGVWLHLRDRHGHEHTHAPLLHTHAHRHDEHHRHDHEFDWDGSEPHVHPHAHVALTHRHPHYPDVHHRHAH